MKNYSIEVNNDQIHLKIINDQQSGCATFFTLIMGWILFLMPILTILLLSIEITFGSIVVCIVAWLISGYFVRLYLWNKYGEEIFIFKKNSMEHYYNYKYFKDNYKHIDYMSINIAWESESILNNLSGEMSSLRESSNKFELSQFQFELDGNIVTSHFRIPIYDIEEIAQIIKEKYSNKMM